MDVTAINHVAIRTADLASALDFYTQLLGFPEVLRYQYSDGSVLCSYLSVAPGQFLEIFPYGIGEGARDNRAVGYNHVCLEVRDLNTTTQNLARAGVKPTREIRNPDGSRIVFICDLDGNTIELIGPEALTAQKEAVQAFAAGAGLSVIKSLSSAPKD